MRDPILTVMRWFILLLPWIELFSLIQLGTRIGALATLAYVLLTFMLGMSLLKLQGREVVSRLREAQMGWSIPPQLMVDELALGLSGLLLAIPGLVTDVLALLVLAGPLLRRLFGVRPTPGGGQAGPRGPDPRDAPGAEEPIEGEFRRLDDD